MPLVPCSECGRHARAPSCPFCGARGAGDASMRVVGRRGFTRSAIVGTAAVLAGCGASQSRDRDLDEDLQHEELHPGGGPCEEVEVENEDGTTHVQSVCPPYGAPPAERLV